MSSTHIGIHILDADRIQFRMRTLASCHTVFLNVGETEVTFYISSQKQYDEMVDNLQSLVDELAPGRTLVVQEVGLTQEEAACVEDARDQTEVERLRGFAQLISVLNEAEGLSPMQLYHVVRLANAALSPLTQEEAAVATSEEFAVRMNDLSTLDAEHDAIDEALRDR